MSVVFGDPLLWPDMARTFLPEGCSLPLTARIPRVLLRQKADDNQPVVWHSSRPRPMSTSGIRTPAGASSLFKSWMGERLTCPLVGSRSGPSWRTHIDGGNGIPGACSKPAIVVNGPVPVSCQGLCSIGDTSLSFEASHSLHTSEMRSEC